MSEKLPSVTVVIAARPGQQHIPAVDAARRLDYPPERLDIIVARGKQPSAQRNAAIRAARGDVIYFLDDDSVPQPDTLRRAAPQFDDPRVKMVGGPNLCPPDAPLLEQVFAVVLGSWLAFGPSRGRYDAVGRLRESSEKELILCNLMARRDALLEFGGFDESLYPNEENALMDDLQKRGGKLLYDPGCVVYRRPRSSLGAFARMLMTYGRGRAEQFRLHPTPGSALNFVPALLLVYWLMAPPVGLLVMAKALSSGEADRCYLLCLKILLIPQAAYGLALMLQTVFTAHRHGVAKGLLALPLVVLTHVLYGLGIWRGLFTKIRPAGERPSDGVTLEHITVP